MAEAFIFAFVFGIDRGWDEITRGADIQVPLFFKYVIKYVTPAFILVVFLGALVKPAADWGAAVSSLLAGQGWPLAPDSVIGKVLHVGVTDYRWFTDDGYGTPYLIQDMTRALLTLLFIGCALLVRYAWQRKAAGRTA